MMRLNTNGTIEKTPIIIDGTNNVGNISNVTTLTCQTNIVSNVLANSNVFSPNIFLGTFLGNTATAGIFNCNSGNITNTGNITPIGDNTANIGSSTLSYQDIFIKGNVYKNGALYAGNVSGPTSSTDNGIVRFDSTTGKLIQGSGIIISDDDRISGALSLTTGAVWTSQLYNDGINQRGININSGVGGKITFNGDDYKTAGILTNDTSGNITTQTDITANNINLAQKLTLSNSTNYPVGQYLKVGTNGEIVPDAGGGGGSITGISSVDNGGGDIEISFTGNDYKQSGYLTTDVNGRIQVTPTATLPNVEWTNIVNYWKTQSGNTSANVSAILLKSGVQSGFWTQNDTVYLRYQIGTSAPVLADVTSWSPYQETIVTPGNVQNAIRIYPVDPGYSTNVDIIIGRMLEEWSWFSVPISSINEIWVANTAQWNENLTFWAVWTYSGFVRTSENSFLGSFTGHTYSGNIPPVPAGYTRIF